MAVSKKIVSKKNIEDAAGRLFSTFGFSSVTIRGIAREAGCSHTLIYMYYKDKEDLLHQMAVLPLDRLESTLRVLLADRSLTPRDRLLSISKEIVGLCLLQRCMGSILFQNLSTPLHSYNDRNECELLRLRIYDCMQEAVYGCLAQSKQETQQTVFRVYLFMIHGLIMNFLEHPGSQIEQQIRAIRMIERCIDILLGEQLEWPSITEKPLLS
ncbi:MAG: TetR/AcrR family transcriptional regulator [Gorillibacterium sp.]|nr:TetR/AcrR family transcriptional regulator [Gorillibacterium sp.]